MMWFVIYILSAIGLYCAFKFWWYGENGKFKELSITSVDIVFVLMPLVNTIWFFSMLFEWLFITD